MFIDPDHAVAQIKIALADAQEILGNDFVEAKVLSWPQVWSTTTMGFGGIGGAMMTWAQTVVLHVGQRYLVYHGGRFAYRIESASPSFRNCLEVRKLAGQHDREEWEGYDMGPMPLP